MPDPSGRIALVCYRTADISKITFWPDRAQAVEAVRELVPCDKGCANCHAIVFVDGGRIRTEVQPAQAVLIAPVIPGSWRADTSRRLVACKFCDGQHSHSHHQIGTVRPSGCLKGFYRITYGANEMTNDQPEEEP